MRRSFNIIIGVVFILLSATYGTYGTYGTDRNNGTDGKNGKGKEKRNYHTLIKGTVPLVTVEALAGELNGKDAHKASPMLLDTRKLREYKVSHLKGARHVGYKLFNLKRVDDIPKDAPIVVYCSLGVRSEKIGLKLRRAGYTNVRNLLGGLFGWVDCGHPVYDAGGSPTSKVHAYSIKWGKWLEKGEKVF